MLAHSSHGGDLYSERLRLCGSKYRTQRRTQVRNERELKSRGQHLGEARAFDSI